MFTPTFLTSMNVSCYWLLVQLIPMRVDRYAITVIIHKSICFESTVPRLYLRNLILGKKLKISADSNKFVSKTIDCYADRTRILNDNFFFYQCNAMIFSWVLQKKEAKNTRKVAKTIVKCRISIRIKVLFLNNIFSIFLFLSTTTTTHLS